MEGGVSAAPVRLPRRPRRVALAQQNPAFTALELRLVRAEVVSSILTGSTIFLEQSRHNPQ
jgi:hypothetical protein